MPHELVIDLFVDGKRVPHILRDYDEYQRRNLLVAGAIGARAEAQVIRARLLKMKNPPKWLLKSCDVIEPRVDQTINDLVKWRDTIGYEPLGGTNGK